MVTNNLPQLIGTQNALERALKGIDAQMCIRLSRSGEGDNETITTSFSKKDMNYFVCMELAEEIALSLRLRRIAPGLKDPHEERDLLQLDPEAKLCVTYDPETQDYHYVLGGRMTPMDGAIACESVAATCRSILYAPALLSTWNLPPAIALLAKELASGSKTFAELHQLDKGSIIQTILYKMGFSAVVTPAVEVESDGSG